MVGRPRTVSDEAILDATGGLIGEMGPHAITLQAVANAVGLSAPTVMQRFGSKRGLLLAVAGRSIDTAPTFDAARRDTATPLEALVRAMTSMVAGIRTRAVLANHLAFLQMDLTDDEFGALAARQSRSLRREITALLDEALEGGDIRPGTNTPALARTVHVTYNGSLVTWALDGRGRLRTWLTNDISAVLHPHRR